jgi:hypothetical protein
MMCLRCVLLFLVFVARPIDNLASQHQPKRETWYERTLRNNVNPDKTDFGSIWEERKRAIIDQLASRYFQYSLGATAIIVVLLVLMFAQHVSQERALALAVRSMADIRRHDEYARQIARDAIRRYNDHIESCNRVIEASESGLWKWISSADLTAMNDKLQSMNDKLTAAQEEIKRLNVELETKAATLVEMSLRSKGAPSKSGDASKPVPTSHIDRINQLELELMDERKKNLHVKGTALDARNS